jgi:hypothetical protein
MRAICAADGWGRSAANPARSQETGTGTFNAANWAVWDASDLRDNFL